MDCVKDGVFFSRYYAVLHSRPQLLPSPNLHQRCGLVCLIFGD